MDTQYKYGTLYDATTYAALTRRQFAITGALGMAGLLPAMSACSTSATDASASVDTNAVAAADSVGAPVASVALPEVQAIPLYGSYAQRQEVMASLPAMAQHLHLPVNFVRNAVGNANFLSQVPRLVLPARRGSRKRNWHVYRRNFIDAARIQAGVRFWRQHAHALQRAQQEFGVPAKYIVGIIGVETIYGANKGNIRVIDALSTLAFDFPAEHPRAHERQQYFLSELQAYLQLTWKNKDDPLQLVGSYAGAMGMPQFMPSSWTKYAVDFDGNGHIDLFHSAQDAIGSVANYFKQHGWVTGLEPQFHIQFGHHVHMDALLENDIFPSLTQKQMADYGAWVQVPDGFDGKLALIQLENGHAAPQYWAGTQNFWVITRYNRSSFYAQSVIDLANEVERAWQQYVR